jgi:hypothetical protein
MTPTTTLPPDAVAYLDQVRAALADLPPEERDDLLADVEPSLAEAAADGPEPLAERLGPPERFAEELRVAAGLPARQVESPPAPSTTGLLDRLREFTRSPRGRSLARAAHELAPIWWAVRGYVAYVAVALMLGRNWYAGHVGVPDMGAEASSVIAPLLAAGVSVWLGHRARRRPERARVVWLVANVAVVLAIVPVLAKMSQGTDASPYSFVEPAPQPLPGDITAAGRPVQNIYPYSRDGRLLLDVLLYDQNGQPITIGTETEPDRRVLRTATGEAVLNSFPVRYFDPGTRRVANPVAGPQVRPPDVVTPSLRPPSRSARG